MKITFQPQIGQNAIAADMNIAKLMIDRKTAMFGYISSQFSTPLKYGKYKIM